MDVSWLELTAASVPAGDEWLSPAEAARSAALRFAKRRADWRLGRWTAKQAVAARLNLRSPAEIEIVAAASGAPEVFVCGEPAPVAISLSHRAGVAACAVAAAGVALGCDLEIVEPRSDAFATDYFTAQEQLLIAHASAAERWRTLALLWSAKESVLKALREGLRIDTRRVQVDLDATLPPTDGPVWRRLHAYYGAQKFDGWWGQTGDLVRTMAAVRTKASSIDRIRLSVV